MKNVVRLDVVIGCIEDLETTLRRNIHQQYVSDSSLFVDLVFFRDLLDVRNNVTVLASYN